MAFRSLMAVVVFSLAAGAGTYGVYMLAGWPFGLPQLALLGFLAVLTGGLVMWQENGLAKDPKGFLFRFMIGLVIKLIAALAVVAGILLLLPRARALPLALTFAVLYLLFLVFSTVRLSNRSRNLPRQ